MRLAIDALPGGLRVLRGGAGREHDRPRVGRAGDRSTSSVRSSRAPSASRRQARWPSPTSTSNASAQERMRTPTFDAAAAAAGHPEFDVPAHRIRARRGACTTWVSLRPLDRFPFVPDDPAEARPRLLRGVQHPGAGAAQAAGGHRHRAPRDRRLRRSRLESRAAGRRAHVRRAGLPRANILGFTMPGFATSERPRATRGRSCGRWA